jgi:hypothetical protein
MTRYKASFIHFLISALVVSIIFSIIFFVWYPGPTFRIAGAVSIVLVLVAVDLVLGPTLTLIVYKEGKPGLKFDLIVIAMLQLTALVYGSYTFFQERPYYMVFAVDRFNLVTEGQVDKSKILYPELKEKPFADVIQVFARLPEDPEEFQRFLNSVMFDGMPDLESRPEYWEPYANGREKILQATKPLEEMVRKSDKDERRVQAAIERFKEKHPQLGYVAIGTLDEDIGMVMDMETGEPLGIIDVDPWPQPAGKAPVGETDE